ncbi:MAG: tetraacyldisaccharide 4'-kinase [Phycisphaerales bacterium]
MTERVPSPTKIPNAITRICSWGYRVGIDHVNRRYDRGVGVERLDVPVISVGNLSAGGTGKTPMVHWIARTIQEKDRVPMIAMRGYGARGGEMGDEELVHRESLPGVEVVAQPDRLAGIRKAKDEGARFDAVVLDDGFQHRKIARGLDMVLIDASRPPYEDALLPRGFLREPSRSLRRADAVVITHRELVSTGQFERLVCWLRRQVPERPIAVTSHAWVGMDRFERVDGRWESQPVEVDSIRDQRVFGVCGIGNPDGFYAAVQEAKGEIVDSMTLADHHRFGVNTAGLIVDRMKESQAEMLVMTQKDWVKARETLGGVLESRGLHVSVLVPRLGLAFDSGENAIRTLVEQALRQ